MSCFLFTFVLVSPLTKLSERANDSGQGHDDVATNEMTSFDIF